MKREDFLDSHCTTGIDDVSSSHGYSEDDGVMNVEYDEYGELNFE